MSDSRTSSDRGDFVRERRQLKGRFINPRAQLRFASVLAIISFSVLILFIFVTIFSLNKTIGTLELAEGLQPAMANVLRRSFAVTFAIAMGLGAVLSALTVVFGILWSHRVYGPLIPLRRHIEELKTGNFTSRVHLRKRDELLELQDALNDLAESLEARYGSSGKNQVR